MSAMPLYNRFDEWNAAAVAQKETFREVRNSAADWLFRSLLYDLKPHNFVLMACIFDRTFRWGKYAEAIPHSHFLNGIEDVDDDGFITKRRMASGQAVCPGMGRALSNSKSTLTKHLSEIIDQGHVVKLPARRRSGRPVSSFIFNEHLLAEWVVAANGSLPSCAPLVRLAPVLIEDVPVRLIGRRTVAAETEGDEEQAGAVEYQIMMEERQIFWVPSDQLRAIPVSDWPQVKKENSWLKYLPTMPA